MNDREVIGTMQPIPFDPGNDLAPIPFDKDFCELTQRLKKGAGMGNLMAGVLSRIISV
jgi:hypothetical protein